MTRSKIFQLCASLTLGTVLATGVLPDPQAKQANAQTLFELLFKKRQRVIAPPRVEIKKVSAPKYYGYKAAPMVGLKLAALKEMAQTARLEDVEGKSNFLATQKSWEWEVAAVETENARRAKKAAELTAKLEAARKKAREAAEAERLEAERIAAERAEAQRIAAEMAEQKARLEAEAAAEKLASEKIDGQHGGEVHSQTDMAKPETEAKSVEMAKAENVQVADNAAVEPMSDNKVITNSVEIQLEEPLPVALPLPAKPDFEYQPKFTAFLSGVSQLEKLDVKATKQIAAAVQEHYAASPKMLWVADGVISSNGKAVLETLSSASEFGLMADDYAVQMPAPGADDAAMAAFDIALSVAATRYVMDARIGKVNPNRLSGYHDFPAKKYTAAMALKGLSTSGSVAEFMAQANPLGAEFAKFKTELAALRLLADDVITIADKTLIKPGMNHDEMPNVIALIRKKASIELKQQHGEALTAYSGGTEYSPELVALVKGFQKEKKLGPDGIIGRNTISKLSEASPKVRIKRVELAMERLRWHPRELGDRRVFINQPAYQARYIEGGEEKLAMRVIVGKRSNQTTFFHDVIERVEYNPYWGVPQSIIINEMLPKLRADPSYLDARGYEVTDVRGRKLSSTSVDWNSVGGGQVPYNVRQLPGARNALGELKILFPNKHAIYMHDTPSRGLFKRSQRALSHGCVRLHRPRDMAAAVLGTSIDQIASKIATGKNNAQELSQQIPVYVAYFTAWPNKDGKVEYFPDIYGRDKHLAKAIARVSTSRGVQG